MEPLIHLRSLSSKLKADELNQLIQTIIQSFGAEQIISFIFNHFLHKYQTNKIHDDDLQNIINMISKIIQSRDKKKSLSQESSEEKTDIDPIKIDSLPPEIIREYSSYLSLKDYMIFARSNRAIYCASNSPLTLKKLDICRINNYYDLNLNRFRLIQSLSISPNNFNLFESSSYPMSQHYFINLHKLHIFNDGQIDPQIITTFMSSKIIDFSQITHLTLRSFGRRTRHRLYDFGAFCEFLNKFPNVSNLEMEHIYLTSYNAENKTLSAILPKLTQLNCWNLHTNRSANMLRNKLIEMYSNQLILLHYDEFTMNINAHSFDNLMNLHVANLNEQSLENVINSTSADLKRLYLYGLTNTETIKNTIIKSFQKFQNLNRISLICSDNNELQHIISFTEIGLLKSRTIHRKSLTLIIAFVSSDPLNVIMMDIELYITRIVNALDAAKIEHFMLKFYFHQDIDRNGYKYKIIEIFKETHFAVTCDDVDEDGDQRIIISNKNCKINGYAARPISQE